MTVDIETYLHEEVAAAVEDITILSKKDPPLNPLGQINPKAVAAARVLTDPPRHSIHSRGPCMHNSRPAEPFSHRLENATARRQGLFFFHTRKVGLLAGIKFGRGFLLERQSPPHEQPARWSAPVFYTVQEGSFGLTAGAHCLTDATSLTDLRLSG